MSDGGSPRACAACGSPLDGDQRYCLQCGERAAPRSGQLAALLERARAASAASAANAAASAAAGAATSGEAVPSAPGAPPLTGAAPTLPSRARRPGRAALASDALVARVGALRLPSRRVSAVLLLAFLGFGVLLGNAAGSRVDYSLADSKGPLKVVVPPSAPAPSTTTPAEETETSSEPPEAPEESTPEPAPAVTPSAPAPAPKHSEAPAANEGSQGEEGASSPAKGATKLPAIKHVFVVMLSNEPYAATFGPESSAPYLAHTLEKRGELLARYYAIAHQQLPNGIALLSGQGPTPATAANCPTFADVAPASAGSEGQALGEGCVYPATTPTLPGQLEVKHETWRAYVQGLGEAGGPPACSHPEPGASDPSATPPQAQSYATFRNPFVYFHSVIDAPSCAQSDVGLAELDADLASAKRTPALSYIVPDLCHDGSPGPCPGGGPGGLPAADSWLQQVVPKILASPAYKHGGLLVITADEAPSSGEFADSSSCCGQPSHFPNLPAPASSTLGPEGGGQVGALLLSPFVKGGVITQEQYDHFSLLRTIEDLFSLKHLGYAGAAKTKSFEPSLFQSKPSR